MKTNIKFITIFFIIVAVSLSTIIYQNYNINKSKELLKKNLMDISDRQYDSFNTTYPGVWKIVDGMLYKGDLLIKNSEEVLKTLDKMKVESGTFVTIFQGDTRVATNVKKADGSRAVGTRQTDEKVKSSVLTDSKIYSGEAIVVATYCETKYSPIKDSSGKVIGMWFTGVSNDKIINQQVMLKETVIVSIIAGLALLVMGLVVAFRNTKTKNIVQ